MLEQHSIFTKPDYESPSEINLIDITRDKFGDYWAIIYRKENWIVSPSYAVLTTKGSSIGIRIKLSWSDENSPEKLPNDTDIVFLRSLSDKIDIDKYLSYGFEMYGIMLPFKPDKVIIS